MDGRRLSKWIRKTTEVIEPRRASVVLAHPIRALPWDVYVIAEYVKEIANVAEIRGLCRQRRTRVAHRPIHGI